MPSQLERVRFRAPVTAVRVERLGRASQTEADVVARLKHEFERGWEAGQRDLGQKLVDQRAELITMQQALLKRLRDAVDQVARETEQHLAEITVAYVEKIVGALPISAESIAAVVKEAVDGLAPSAVFEIRLHPEDLNLLERLHEEVGGVCDQAALVADANLSRGDCVVRTKFGIIDASRATKLSQVREALLCSA